MPPQNRYDWDARVYPGVPMNLTPTLQQEIDQLAQSQGISSEQFILQAIAEKITVLKQPASVAEASLKEKDGLLVFDTEPLDHIDFNTLIDQNRDRSWDYLGL
jgi:hypothetical protein